MFPTAYGYGPEHWSNWVSGDNATVENFTAYNAIYNYGNPAPCSDAVMVNSTGDTSQESQLLDSRAGTSKDEFSQENTIPLPEELTKMFRPRVCMLCETSFTSDVTAYTHYEGRTHQKAVASYMLDHYKIKGSLLRRRARFKPVICEVCNITLTSQVVHDTHFAGKNHAKKLRKMVFKPTEPEREDLLDFMFQPPPPPPPPKLNEFVCEECHITTNTEQQLMVHKQGVKHRKMLERLNDGDYEDYGEIDEEEYHEENQDYLNDDEKGPVEHVDDPQMDQPLQFDTSKSADSQRDDEEGKGSTEQIVKSNDFEQEISEMWSYLDELMLSDPSNCTARKHDVVINEATTEPHEIQPDVLKVHPAAAPILHKYKSAQEARNGDMIKMVIQPDKPRIKNVEVKKKLYLPPEIRRKIGSQSGVVEDETSCDEISHKVSVEVGGDSSDIGKNTNEKRQDGNSCIPEKHSDRTRNVDGRDERPKKRSDAGKYGKKSKEVDPNVRYEGDNGSVWSHEKYLRSRNRQESSPKSEHKHGYSRKKREVSGRLRRRRSPSQSTESSSFSSSSRSITSTSIGSDVSTKRSRFDRNPQKARKNCVRSRRKYFIRKSRSSSRTTEDSGNKSTACRKRKRSSREN